VSGQPWIFRVDPSFISLSPGYLNPIAARLDPGSSAARLGVTWEWDLWP
jgi:hypothetical protein